MKTKTRIAAVFAAIIIPLISCDWLFSKKISDRKIYLVRTEQAIASSLTILALCNYFFLHLTIK